MSRLKDAVRVTLQGEVDHAVRNLNLPQVTCLETSPPLEDLQKSVGGLIEAVYLDDGRCMWVNEEGLLKRLAFNAVASEIARRPIVGNVVIVRDWKD